MQILPFLLPCLQGVVRTARDGSAVPSSPEQSSWRSRASFLESWWAALLLQTRAFLCCSPSALGAAEFLCSYVMDCRWLCLENLLFFFTAGGGQEPCPTSAGSLLTELLAVGAEMPGRRAAEGSTGAVSPLCPKHLPEPLFSLVAAWGSFSRATSAANEGKRSGGKFGLGGFARSGSCVPSLSPGGGWGRAECLGGVAGGGMQQPWDRDTGSRAWLLPWKELRKVSGQSPPPAAGGEQGDSGGRAGMGRADRDGEGGAPRGRGMLKCSIILSPRQIPHACV